MQKFPLECFYIIKRFTHHNKIKDTLLSEINKSEYESLHEKKAEVDISKCDWHVSTNYNRDWFLSIKDMLFSDMLEMYADVGYDGFTLQEIWFQQYNKNSQHGWHTHSSNFTNVYYLELPKNSSRTQIVSPYDQSTIIELDVSEGDIVSFPSFVVHKGPRNNADTRKTIISYNTNVTYSDKIYGKNIGADNAFL